ncbi:MAG: phage portal protein, partial [Alphaproteobacteria bacterium]
MLKRIKSILGIERKSVDLSDLLLSGFGSPTTSGITIGPENAMRCAAVFGAVRVLAESLASLPIHVYRRRPDGGRERADDHPLEAILADAANPWCPASEFRLNMQTALSMHGNCYAWVGRADGRVSELIPLDPRTVSVEPDRVTMEPRYFVTDGNGSRREYGRGDILHVRGVGSSLYKGDAPVMLGREAIALSLVLE